MGNIFSGSNNNAPTREFQTRVNQSVYGLPYPVVLGTAQVQQSILSVNGFQAKKAKVGGKGDKGGGTVYLYTADIVAALCCGPIKGIGDVWTGQAWLGSPVAAETYTISGTGVYTPVNGANLQNDLGVGVQNSYSGTYNDYGAPSSTLLSGNDYAVMQRVDYASVYQAGTMARGQYAIDNVGNYRFHPNPPGGGGTYGSGQPGNAGQAVQLSYSFQLTQINQQETDIVPAGLVIQVGGSFQFVSDLGVVDYNTQAALSRVYGTPTVAGTYSVSGSNPASYRFSTPDIGREVTITFQIKDPNAVGQGQPQQLNFTLNNGTAGQAPYSFLTSSFPAAAFGFTSVATILYQPMDLGTSAQVQQNKFEVVTPDVYGGGIEDCNPVQCLQQVLTNKQWGLGVGTVPFPTSCIDSGASGTWGVAGGTPGARTVNGTAWNWFAAQNFFISPVIDSQDTAASVASKWLEAGMVAAFMSEGLLKLVPYGDTSAAANGVTWTAPSSYVVALDDTCFVSKDGEDPVKISRVAAHDAWNVVQIQWNNRHNQYSPEITQESDQALINRYGERREDPQQYGFIHTIQAATFAANMRLKHGSYTRSTYEFTLPYSYSYLEPMDICTISTTSVWAAGLNNANLSVTNLPVRITRIVDDPTAGLQITAEDYPFGAHQPTLYNKQISNGDVAANAFAEPGNAEIVMFEATSRMTEYSGNELWIGANGVSANYGSTNVWVSDNGGTSYTQIGSIKAPARMGTLASTFASGSDPDTVNSLVVNLVENCQALESGTTTDADNGNLLCFVDGEIISYSSSTVTGQDQVTMSGYIRRGQMNSTISSHGAGTLFLRLDDAIFKYQYDPSWAGQVLQFKFQAVNAFGNNAQPLSSLTATAFTVPGKNPGGIDASSGLVILAGPHKPPRPGADPTSRSGWSQGAGPLGWTPSA
jgi:Putative phage tail protein